MRDYGTGSWDGGDADCDHNAYHRDRNAQSNPGSGSGAGGRTSLRDGTPPQECRCGARRVDQQLGLEATPDEYVANMVAVFREVRRVLADHGTLWLNLGDSYASSPPGNTTKGVSAASTLHGVMSDRYRETLEQGHATKRNTVVGGLKPKDLVGIPWRVAFALQQPYYAGTIKDERDRIWLAAVIEAEGCLFIHKRKVGQSNGQGYVRKNDSYGAGLEVSSTDRVIVERCMAIAGIGSISEQTPEQNERRKQTIYRWNVRSNECRAVIRELYPHFYAKQHEARLLLACPPSGPDAEKAHESLKAIHQGGTPTIDFAPPASMFEEGWYLRSDVIWAKKNCMPESVTDRPTKAHEYVFLLSKRPRYWFDQEAVREPPTDNPGGAAFYARKGIPMPDYSRRLAKAGQPREGGNDGLANQIPVGGLGRNVRSVWEIATQPYPDAHFATFPEDLPRRCILAGCPEFVCTTCSTPRTRIVERRSLDRNELPRDHPEWRPSRYDNGKAGDPQSPGPGQRFSDVTTSGWSDCGHGDYRPGTVLDPFLGSGTTALVARNHGRHAVGIELNPAYADLAARRLQQLSLLADGDAA